ncbi:MULTISPECIES: acyl-CoA thioesterase [unclassified Lactobacillus]|uniref:acyl-CoA thioesterase n=1 Tax=unclassified Lactobacillus TaxID=2620435 RepID=UPI000EFC7967|nr:MULTISPECIES: hotdog domain-containing protein [unclassified Lactobacillus]RMC25999.1 hypothetical protein F5ESL0247_00360 [Lactobacillus sp. ESL0247]RMC29692.1 hypothetical protein F5ESL0246_00360 [Lactobacillus sp. ESL0246]RMC34097.1 hypothetical protein F5ESL0245_00360 [Lactobacillus sp. ESL0245]
MDNIFFKRQMADYFVTPSMLNHMNITHGGTILYNIDSAMGIFANSYCHSRTLTGRIDKFIFHKKSYVGDHINFCITLLKTTSKTLTIYAEVNRLSLNSSDMELIGEAVFTYVVVDKNLEPIIGAIKPYKLTNTKEISYVKAIKKRFGIN